MNTTVGSLARLMVLGQSRRKVRHSADSGGEPPSRTSSRNHGAQPKEALVVRLMSGVLSVRPLSTRRTAVDAPTRTTSRRGVPGDSSAAVLP